MTGRRMDHETRRLVDDEEVIVFEDDVQLQRHRRQGAAGLGFGKHDFNALAFFRLAGGTRYVAVDGDGFLTNQPSGLGAGDVEELG